MVGMEAVALSATITGILKVVGNKLAPLVIKEYSSIVGVKKNLQELQDLVQEINRQLGTAGDRDTGDVPWLKKLKQVVYDVDDVVDEFQLMAENNDAGGGGASVSKYLHTKTESFLFQWKAAKKIKEIKKRFSEIVKQRTDLTAIFGHDDPVSHINKSAVSMQTLPICDEASILGRDQEKHQIISNLVETNDKQEINIISIVGLGGSGKTTLSKLVFNDDRTIAKHFDVRLWVHVSHEFDIEKLIKKLFEAFADKDPGQHSLAYMNKRIQEGLSQKKFLIVMDDVWTESQNQWNNIMEYLKAGAPGSGVLLTTRSANVADVVRSSYKFCLRRLSPDDSWLLFQKCIRMPAKILESDFIKVGKEIVETCCGLPLAIKVLAGSLTGKELIGEWEAMRNILLDVEGEDSVSACLKLSYFHLPSNLKQCFTMCSWFPKGHLIDQQLLIDQWIAHDMISLPPGVDDLEHIGLRYFHSLVQVYFLQDVYVYTDGRVRCKMHDLIHDLARSILCEEISTVVPEDASSSTRAYRFFSLIEPRKLLPEKVFENARAVYVDRGYDILVDSTLKNAKHLRSIIIENSILSTPVLTSIFEVKNLKCLVMSRLHFETLPEAISNVWSLQALHVTDNDFLRELPQSIGKLKKLRTLRLSTCVCLKSLPESIGDCQMISIIDLDVCMELTRLPDSIGRNEKLRVLKLGYSKVERLPSSITTLTNLECLDLSHCQELVELPEGIDNLEKLQVLNLKDCENLLGMPVGIGQLSQLQELGLFVVGKGEKFAGISELTNLSRVGDEELTIRGISHVMDPNDTHMAWKVGGGLQGSASFPFLRVMKLNNLPNLKNLDRLVGLPCLEELELNFMASLESISGGPLPKLVKLNMCGLSSLESISGGPFPLLVKLEMHDLPCLGEVWMLAEGGRCCNFTPQLGQVILVGNCLTELEIDYCPKLEVKPHLPPSLQRLELQGSEQLLQSPGQCQGSSSSPSFSHLKNLELSNVAGLESGHGWELLRHWTALESLKIMSSCRVHKPNIRVLPEWLGELWSLQELTIRFCKSLSSLPESMGQLTSLQELKIEYCDALRQLPNCLGELCSLQVLEISECPGLTSLPEGMEGLVSLEELEIRKCTGLTSLPEGMKGLVSLGKLSISNCPGVQSLPEGHKRPHRPEETSDLGMSRSAEAAREKQGRTGTSSRTSLMSIVGRVKEM